MARPARSRRAGWGNAWGRAYCLPAAHGPSPWAGRRPEPERVRPARCCGPERCVSFSSEFLLAGRTGTEKGACPWQCIPKADPFMASVAKSTAENKRAAGFGPQARLPAGNRENYSRVPQDLSRPVQSRLQIDQKRMRLERFLTACVHFAGRSLTFLRRIDNINLNYSAMRRQEPHLARLLPCKF